MIVNKLTLLEKSRSVIKEDEIEDGTYKAYTSIHTFVSQLEKLTGDYYQVDKLLQNMFVRNKGMEWQKRRTASALELSEFLMQHGIKIIQEKATVCIYEINNK